MLKIEECREGSERGAAPYTRRITDPAAAICFFARIYPEAKGSNSGRQEFWCVVFCTMCREVAARAEFRRARLRYLSKTAFVVATDFSAGGARREKKAKSCDPNQGSATEMFPSYI